MPDSARPDPSAGGATGPTPVPAPESVRRNWLGVAALGAVLIVGGALAIAAPLAAGIAATVVIGAAVLVAGGVKLWHAFRCAGWRARAWHAISGAIYLVGGVLLLLNPLAGTIALSLLIVAILIVDGVARLIMAFRMRPERGWGWLAASGGLSAAVGTILALFALPAASLTLLGVFAGACFIAEGAAFVYIAFAVRPREDRSVSPA